MIHKNIYRIISIVAVLFILWSPAHAQFQEGTVMPAIGGYPELDSSSLVNGAYSTVSYTPFASNDKIVNVITLKIDEGKSVYFASSFTARVSLTLDCTDYSGAVTTVSNIKLQVNYDSTTGAKYTTSDYKTYKGYKTLKVTVDTITITGYSGWNPRDVLEVTNEIRAIRYYSLSSSSGDLAPTLSTSQPTTDVLLLSWYYPSAARENMTQLEWAYVEKDMLPYYNGDNNLLFNTNSARVDLDQKDTTGGSLAYHFKIPLLFPDTGRLYYRTRAVQRKANGTLIAGPWALDSFAIADGHQPNLNWQYNTTFAEQGKYKTVIQYFDGSLRGRQTVTKDNTTDNTIVGETIYDLQGRPNLQILPTPTIDNTIQYFTNFNRFNGMAANDDPAKYFDLTPEAVKCDTVHALNTNYGNGRYYSAMNDWLSTESKSKYIPDANGFAFTETRYTDDATQRVKIQGGVGLDHQIGMGHETKYFYGKPSQNELDALFGTEVGDASHYSKNMVQDANGQLSVSYVDTHGRTIATALAGDPTPGIDSIINTTDYPLPDTLQNDLLTPATNIIQGKSIVSVSTILVSAGNTYKFTYKLTPDILQLQNCNAQNVCFDCKYDLEISIKGETCGNDSPKVRHYNNLQLVTSSQCSNSMGFTGEGITTPVTQIDFNELLLPGSYVIRKTLTINDSMFQVRRDSALKAFLCKTQTDIYNHIYDSLSVVSGCGAAPLTACDSCNAKLGTFTTYKTNYLAAIAPETVADSIIHLQYSQDSVECANACGGNLDPVFSTLKSLHDQMLRDMIPFSGQYATDTIKTTSGGLPDSTSLDAKYNIFTPRYYVGMTADSTDKPYYKYPETETGINYYLTDEGLVDSTIHAHVNTYQTILDTITVNASFAGIFQNSWAESLVKRHPEYSKWHYADSAMHASYDWLDSVQACSTYAQAYTNGYIVPVKISTSTINDPYFLLASTSADMDTINHKLYDGMMDSVNGSGVHFPIWRGPTMWQMANASVLCAAIDSAHKMDCVIATAAGGLDPAITSTGDKDKVWNYFKSIYLNVRNEMVLRYLTQHAPGALSQADMDELTKHEGKQLVFAGAGDIANQYGWSWWQGITNPHLTDTTGMAHYIDSVQINNCDGQRPFWRARLLQCDSLQHLLLNETSADSLKVDTIINKILDSMVMICHNSITSLQPYGASNVNPSYVGNPRTFESVINNVFNQYGIDTSHHFYFCNPYTIDFPKPFGSNPPVATNYVNKLDSCNCSRFSSILTDAASLGYNPFNIRSINQYLNLNYNDTLTQVMWDGLQKCRYSYLDTCCTPPSILATTLVYGDSGTYYINVAYNTLIGSDSCKIYMYNTSNVLVDSLTDICGTSNSLFQVTDECTSYRFLIKCYNTKCGLLLSDTATYSCLYLRSNGPAGGLNGKGCEYPSISSAVSYSFGKSKGILVSYTLPSSCDSCVLYVYNKFTSLILTVNGICGTTSELLTSLDTCGHYKFLIKCYNTACGTVSSDTAYYDKDCGGDSGCGYPSITSVLHSDTTYKIHVTYTLPSGCDSCKIYMFSPSGTQLAVYSGICGTTDTAFVVSDTCVKYKFLVSCTSDSCGTLSSDTVAYEGCHISCELPYFTAIALEKRAGGNYYVHLNYALTTYCDSCRIYMYNEAGALINQYNYVCNTTDTTFQIYDTCAIYQFLIKCDNPVCGTRVSDTVYYYRPCGITNPCLIFRPVYLPSYEPLPAFLNCGYVKPCITCSQLVDVLTPEFRTIFSAYSGVPYLDSTATDAQSKQNALWARFLNYRTGFTKTTMEYLTAYRNCTLDTPSITMLCASDKPLNDPSDVAPKDTIPCKNVITQAQFITDLIMSKMKDSLLANFDSLYLAKCLGAQSNEQFYVKYIPKEYHYTLYYYDQAGNLVKTIPPAGVKPNFNKTFLDSVQAARAAATDLVNYRNNTYLVTQYRYNSLNQVVAQRTPDAGTSHFWYDRLGRLVISQNSKQQPDNKYSYTLYDALGRITQVGEKQQTQTMSQDTTQNDVALQRWLDDVTSGGSLKEQITRTVYDVPYYNDDSTLYPELVQQNLRNRVSYSQVIDQEPADFATNPKPFMAIQAAATYYSYDIHGNVDTLVQDFKAAMSGTDSGNRYKKMVYDYDLVSGKVNRVAYQPGYTDQFYHVYSYDAENRIISVSTSHDSIYWESEASYEYYRHGPLSRVVLGNNWVQGLDYAYTIQGWLKGVNATALSSGVYDMGKDGAPTGNGVARDAYGYSLNYFYGDYAPIGTGTGGFVNPFVSITNSLATASDGVALGKDLFNGNIRAMMVNVPKLGEAKLYGYRYDQLNRIKAMNSFNGFNNSTNLFSGGNAPTVTEDYRERVNYDPNGNILKYVRHGATALSGGITMDSLSYGYNFDGNGLLMNNKLRHVKDPVSSGNYTDDIDNQSDDNYTYDSIGNMISDAQSNITAVTWTVYGKIKKITKSSGDSVVYSYDATGNRISKIVYVSGVATKTVYVRDASGNVMSLYAKDATINSGTLSQTEVSMYGSSRLGVWNLNRKVDVSSLVTIDYSAYSGTFIRGNKLFELSNHLGNVLATISDKHVGVDSNSNGYVDYYVAEVVTANDYYPFGM
ncbi:MAG: hypothetical protein JST86_16370, partial [Bacteroidetes bacterium]|nr:hypothetical protein [Bacteroidota bacterium]